MGTLQIKVLGAPEVRHDGQVVKFRSRKVLALLLYLAVEGHRVAREKISTLLWPESDEGAARATLRRTLADLRIALDEGPEHAHLVVERDALAFAFVLGDELDVHAIDAAFEELSQPVPATEQERLALMLRLQRAIQVARGAFLEGFSPGDASEFDDWVDAQRAMWQRRMNLVYERLAHLQAEQGEVPAALETVGRWLAREPLQESAYQRLMQLYLTAGDYRAALNVYEDCRRVLAEELGASPLPETQALAERVCRTASSTGAAGAQGKAFSSLPLARQENAPLRAPSSGKPATREAAILMVGRAREHLALVEIYQQAVQQGQAQVAIISGEAGIGKTRIAHEFLGWARACGADILQARAFETGGRLPYQPLLESLRPRLERENAPDDLLSDTWLAELARLFPELRDRYPDLPGAAADETTARVRLYEAITRLGQALAERAPLVIFLDDLHWADAATLDVLHYAVRRWKESHRPLMLLLTLRSEHFVEPLSDLERETKALHLHLDALAFEEVMHLLETLALTADKRERERMEAFGRWLFAETGGQPLYVTETLKALMERGLLTRIPRNDGLWHIDFLSNAFSETALRRFLPPGVREVIRVRLNRLTPASFALLAAGAVLGRNASFEELCQVAGLDEQTGLNALDEVLQYRFLREEVSAESAADTIMTTTYFFAHDKVRDVVYSETGDARRRVFHRRALEVVRMAPAAERVQHALAGGLPVQAYALCVAAGDEAMLLFAIHNASVFYERALRLLPAMQEPAPLPAVQHLYTQLGRAYELTNRAEQAEQIYRDMLASAQQMHSIAMECAALSRQAILSVQVRLDFARANQLLELALRKAEEAGDSALIADVEWHFAQVGFYDFDAPTIVAHGQRSLALARELSAVELMARNLNVLSYAKKQTGALDEAENAASEAVRLFQAIGNRAMQVDSLCVLSDIQLNRGRVEEGMQIAQESYELSMEIGNVWGQVNGMYHLAFGKLDQGACEEALALAERCVLLTEEFKLHVLQANSYMLLGIVQRSLHRMEEACATHQKALEIGQHMRSAALTAAAAAELCADYALMQQWDAAVACALQVVNGKSDLFVMVFGLSRWYVTEALLRAGKRQLTLEDLERWQARSQESPRHRIPYLRASALCARALGQTERAATALQEALSIARTLHLAEEQKAIEAALLTINL